MEHILIVDDEKPMRELIKFYLIGNGYRISEAEDGREALAMLRTGEFDLLLVDWMMPDMDGRELCRQVRTSNQVPIIMLTARNQLKDKIQGFESGADDYLTKPFEEAELIVRIKALIRRARSSPAARRQIVQYKGLSMNVESHEVTYESNPVHLTAHEFALLRFMLFHPGQALTRDQIIEHVWGIDFDGDDRTVDSHIRNLRGKLRECGAGDLIKTLWGVGYKLI
ncbi:transcriptional regulator [Paenibacillus darwinianus]|uniref:Transcriptional regulator n=1 Tax=Paenibacillus darwinianus TaxID=1380763 RepID=A0A9W5S0G9_9BACL|nr:response regulator transcription factor [Paenibacillus darwinianus]EXX87832.1 transcriptional regulator [Paenibacillus darwinianus]